MLTVTNNTGGGQPVSMENVGASSKSWKSTTSLMIDACRFAESAFFIKEREQGFADRSLLEIAQEMFSFADRATMSAKKEGRKYPGGFRLQQRFMGR
jgi:tryptophanase